MKILVLLILIFSFSANAFEVTTWNIQRGKKHNRIVKELKGKLGQSDVILLQEVKEYNGRDHAKVLGDMFKYYSVQIGSDAVLSKYEIVNSGKPVINSKTGRGSIFADLDVNGVIVRVYGPHLSYKVKRNPFIPRIRASEMEAIMSHLGNFPGPVVIGGDLNTIGFILGGQSKEPSLKVLKREGFKNALKKCYAVTQFAGHFLPMGRIDWVFSRGLERLGCKKGRFAGSDHRWMMGKFKYPY